MDNNYSGPINDKDKETLNTAGVDISGGTSDVKPKDDIKPSQEEEKIIDIDGSIPSANDTDIKDSGIHFVEEEKLEPNKEDLSTLAEEKEKKAEVASKDLEEEFRSELANVKAIPDPENNKSILSKSESLTNILSKMEDRLKNKKTKVKEELSRLKEMKDDISKDISEIKSMEVSEEKIKEELNKIESIKKEIEDIEEEFKNEKL